MPDMKMKPDISLDDDVFGAVLNCAVRYSIGRRTYMPSVVIGFITPLLPYLSSRTVRVFDQDVTGQRYESGYGDPNIDEPYWMRFLEAVRFFYFSFTFYINISNDMVLSFHYRKPIHLLFPNYHIHK